jgi:hypothetical protein
MKIEIVEHGGKWYWVVFTDVTRAHSSEGICDSFAEAVKQVESVL